MTTAIFSDDGLLSEGDFLTIEQGAERVELFDGSLLVSPGPTPAHQHIYDEFKATVKRAAREAGFHVHGGVNVRLRPGRISIPDIVVTPAIDFYELVVDVSAVRFVGEILSPSNQATDKVMKMHYYAMAGIPWYLLIDPVTGELRLYQLAGTEYAERSAVKIGEILHLSDPFVADIDPADLLPPR